MLTVIKLGGSLLKAGYLPACLDAVMQYPDKILLAPGGGEFADQVRESQKKWCFDDLTAHRMAILAMQQMALLFKALKSEFGLLDDLNDLSHMPRITIWMPEFKTLDQSDIPASWDISSDSLAAWLAGQVGADELIVVKSCDVAEDAKLDDLQRQGVVDAGFLDFVNSAGCKTTVVNQARFSAMS